MRLPLITGVLAAVLLSACNSAGTGSKASQGDNHPEVCQEQSDMARNGKIPSGEIGISCPDHDIGDYRP